MCIICVRTYMFIYAWLAREIYYLFYSHSSLVEQLNYCMLLYAYASTLQLGLIVEIIYVYMYSKYMYIYAWHAQEIYTTINFIYTLLLYIYIYIYTIYTLYIYIYNSVHTFGSMLKFHWLSIHYVHSNAWQSGCTSPCMMQRVYSGD